MARDEDIAVTGMGVVSPYGVGLETFWSRLTADRPAVTQLADERLRGWAPVGARVVDFVPGDHLPRKLVKQTDPYAQMALVAAAEALEQAELVGIDGELAGGVDHDRVGTAVGTALGGVQTYEAGLDKLAQGGSRRVGPRLVSMTVPNAAASTIDIRYGFRGPSITYTTTCAASCNAVGESLPWLLRGEVDYVLAGGADSLWASAFVAGMHDSQALATTGPEDAGAWSRPFDQARSGMVMGEGAAFVVLEKLSHARARGARVRALLAGYGTSIDAYHPTSPASDGSGAMLAIRRALASGHLQPADIDCVNAHATATQAGDAAESRALATVFGAHLDALPVSSIKGAIGHLMGASAIIETVASIKTLETGIVPATLNCPQPDPDAPKGLIRLHSRHAATIDTVMSDSFGFGGQNGILIWRRAD